MDVNSTAEQDWQERERSGNLQFANIKINPAAALSAQSYAVVLPAPGVAKGT